MRRALARVALLAVFFTAVIALPTSAMNDGIDIIIDGVPVDFDEGSGYPFIDENNRTIVPFRRVLEAFGAEVFWDSETSTAFGRYQNQTVQVPVGSRFVHSDDETFVIDTEAVIKDGRTYLPIRAVVECFGAAVGWDSEYQRVSVIKDALVRMSYKAVDRYGLGMGTGTVKSRFGEPDLIIRSIYGFDWWIYRNGYKDYLQLGIDPMGVKAVYVTSPLAEWDYDIDVGMNADAVTAVIQGGVFRLDGWSDTSIFDQRLYRESELGGYYVIPYYDQDRNNMVDGVLILDESYRQTMTDSGDEGTALTMAFEQQVLELTNVFRQKNGLAALVLNPGLSDVARNHSKDMALRDYFDHISPEGITPFDRIAEGGYHYHVAAENIAAGQRTPMVAVNDWINSSGHRQSLLGDYEEIGVGIYFDEPEDIYGIYYTQNFRTK